MGDGSAETAESRLQAYEEFARDVHAELDEVCARMDDLRARGRVKTATYRQLFACRQTCREICRRLEEHGLQAPAGTVPRDREGTDGVAL